jgi:hypothetical protein
MKTKISKATGNRANQEEEFSLTDGEILKSVGFNEETISQRNISRAILACCKLLDEVRATKYSRLLLQPLLKKLEQIYRDPNPMTNGQWGTHVKQIIVELYCVADARAVPAIEHSVAEQAAKECRRLLLRIKTFQHIEAFQRILVSAPDICMKIEEGRLVAADEATERAFLYQAHSTAERGRALRTLSEFKKAATGAVTFLKALQEVNRGAEPGSLAPFRGTVLEMVAGPHDAPAKLLWKKLLNLANMVVAVSIAAIERKVDPESATLLFDPKMRLHEIHEDWVISEATDLTWTVDYVQSRLTDWPSNLIVERPIIVINGKWQTNTRLLMESMVWWIECAILQYGDAEQCGWASRCRQHFVSTPFEKAIIAKMRADGMQAGSVSMEAQEWDTGNENISLISRYALPGEIDCLAVNERARKVYILECKVLDEPYTLEKARKRHQKLTSRADKGFQAKLTRKAAWVSALERFQGYTVIPKIIVDRPVIEMFDRKYANEIVSAMFVPAFIDKAPSQPELDTILKSVAKSFTT